MLKDPVYLDSSAAVKLVIREPESECLRNFLEGEGGQPTTSVFTEIECVRAMARFDPDLSRGVSRLLRSFVLLPFTESMRLRATHLRPARLRSLDAIQLATALEIQTEFTRFVSYDERLNGAATSAGLVVETPTP